MNKKTVEELYKSGLTQKEIGKIYNTTASDISVFMKANNIAVRSSKDAQIDTIIYDDQTIQTIFLLYNKGYNREQIAKEIKSTSWGVRKIIEGKCRGISETQKLLHKINTKPLSYDQKQLIYGSLLGDSSISYRKNVDSYDFQSGHCEQQKEYSEHKAYLLGVNVCEVIKDISSFSAGKKFYKISYGNKYELEKIYDDVFINEKKSPNTNWMKQIDASAIAYWFMDDGSSSYDSRPNYSCLTVEFSTQGFSYSEIEYLQSKLLEFGIFTSINKSLSTYKGISSVKYRLRIKQHSINTLMNIIEPTIVKIPCMIYKIKRK